MEKLNAIMSKKIAGIPVMAIAALFAGVILFYAIRMKPADTEEATDESAPVEDDSVGGDPGDTSQPVFQANPTILQPSGVVTGSTSVTAIPQADSNDLWKERVLAELLNKGYSYNVAAGMVSKFLSGTSLSVEEAKVRDAAVKQYGMPPDGVEFAADKSATTTQPVVPSVTPKPAPKAVRQGTPPLKHVVKNASDNTIPELALLYYGYVTTANKRKIAAANAMKSGPFPVGSKVQIPRDTDPKYYKSTAHVNTIHEIAKKNGTTAAALTKLNPKMKFPVKAGTSVRVA